MPKSIAGFPFWQVDFDDAGNSDGQNSAASLVTDATGHQLTDIFVFSHGWNNDHATAAVLYEGFFKQLRSALPAASASRSKIGVAGVFWPSILWPDETPQNAGGAAALQASDSMASLKELSIVFPHALNAELRGIVDLINGRSADDEKLRAFGAALNKVMTRADANTASEDSLELKALSDKTRVKDAQHALSYGEIQSSSEGGAAGLGDSFAKFWDGAKGALRVATYWQMRNRAGVVGKLGLGPLIDRLSDACPSLRIHLIGHSFGARLVSFSLAGMKPNSTVSPVKSLFLLQGAFSHFAFADQLPFERTRSGELKGMASRVDGPLLATFSDFDLAVGRSYPLASIVAQQDASDARTIASRWGAMGSDGAQAVLAAEETLGAVGHKYAWKKQRWHNLDGNSVITVGGPPSGAHSDIIHPEIAWAAISAAGLV